jgi:hypothetical protein
MGLAIADNFYVDSDVSAEGHRWLVNTHPNEWVETCTPASYGGNRDYKPASKAPGSLGMNGAAGAIYPEDYTALAPDIRVFDPQKALSPLDEKFDWKSLKESPELDDPKEMLKDQKEKVEFRSEDQKKK